MPHFQEQFLLPPTQDSGRITGDAQQGQAGRNRRGGRDLLPHILQGKPFQQQAFCHATRTPHAGRAFKAARYIKGQGLRPLCGEPRRQGRIQDRLPWPAFRGKHRECPWWTY